MRHNIKIKAITPVHVGSGDELMPGTEYVSFQEENVVAVINTEKIPKFIGGMDNIDEWMEIIKRRGDLLTDLLQKYHPDIRSDDISSRIIMPDGALPEKEKINAHLHLGSKLRPTIPGTSIKGSIRTGLLNHLIKEKPEFAADYRNIGRERRSGIQYKDAKIQAHYLAPRRGDNYRVDPRKDLLRLLRVGDAYFDYQTVLYKSMVVNEFQNGWDEKHNLSGYFECIPAGSTTEFNISIPEDTLNAIRKGKKLDIPKDFPAYDVVSLLRTVNNQTISLLKDEIEFWKKENDPDAIGDYLNHLTEIYERANNCGEGECVLRVGAGSGWDFMTGAWPRGKDNNGEYILDDYTWKKLKGSLRRKHYPEHVIFPKTRKLLKGGIPFGFVSLSIVD